MLIDSSTLRPVGILLAVAVLTYLRVSRRKDAWYLACVAVFSLYLVEVIGYTLFPLTFGAGSMRVGAWSSAINLVPLQGIGGRHQIVGNVVLGISFGFGLPFVWRCRPRDVLKAGVVFAVGIECLQAIVTFLLRWTVRSIDIDDVLLNYLGVMIGLGTFLLVSLAYRQGAGTSAPSRSTNHIAAVLTQTDERTSDRKPAVPA